jgi:hypothetical protein
LSKKYVFNLKGSVVRTADPYVLLSSFLYTGTATHDYFNLEHRHHDVEKRFFIFIRFYSVILSAKVAHFVDTTKYF